jgi:hypothetical protein
MVFDSLLDNHSFWELLFVPLVVESKGSTVQNLFLAETKPVISWVEFPVIVSIFLLTGCVISMSLSIHCRSSWIVSDMSTSHWINHFLCIFESLRWNTERQSRIFLYLIRPVIPS